MELIVIIGVVLFIGGVVYKIISNIRKERKDL